MENNKKNEQRDRLAIEIIFGKEEEFGFIRPDSNPSHSFVFFYLSLVYRELSRSLLMVYNYKHRACMDRRDRLFQQLKTKNQKKKKS